MLPRKAENRRKSLGPKKNLAISAGADILAATQKSNERLLHISRLARRGGKTTWKTPKAA
ncbi:hypothetical protein GFL49_33430 [Rhizobium leguminosarum bv. viciae]|nr:hypothetical protein [Rhizobium leguminosarum bv. viciae]